MAITNILKSIILDVYDHDNKTPKTIKAIAADNDVRYIAAEIQNEGVRYDVSASSTVELIILRPDKVGVSITGQPQQFTYETDPVFDPDTGETTPGETVTYYGVYAELDQAALAKTGILLGQFKITNGEQILHTEIFKVNNGRALDIETSDWEREYQGYNLDEFAEMINGVKNMTVTSQTLPQGASATVTKTEDEDGVVHLAFGIPTGANGISPTVTITPITGGHRITITDADGTETADVMDGHNGMVTVNVSGTTPTITAQADYRYVCGEVSTLDLTPPASGICDVVFESGATATVLTVPNTIKWANGFDPTSLDANTTYEINIMDGLGVVVGWT